MEYNRKHENYEKMFKIMFTPAHLSWKQHIVIPGSSGGVNVLGALRRGWFWGPLRPKASLVSETLGCRGRYSPGKTLVATTFRLAKSAIKMV